MIPKFIPIDGSTSLERDTISHGVVNSDALGLEQAKARKASILSLQNEVNDLKAKVDMLMHIVMTNGTKGILG